jgi:hypothetical protein
LGKLLFEKQLADDYGSVVVNQLSVDLKTDFPDMGLSPRNLWDMKRFYERLRRWRGCASVSWHERINLRLNIMFKTDTY